MFEFPQYVPLPEQSRSPDPLGLQTTNMNLYQTVFPGLNNKVRYIRVYSAICWMVRQIWANLNEDSTEDEVQEAFDAGLQKIQLLLTWSNIRKDVPALAGKQRHWPEDGESVWLNYIDIPTRAAWKLLSEDEDAETKDGTTLLAQDEYAPSITNGLQLMERVPGYVNVFELTTPGEDLADGFEKYLQEQRHPKTAWLRDPFKGETKSSIVDALWDVLKVNVQPSKGEQEHFLTQLYPKAQARGVSEAFSFRCKGITLALRALAAEENARAPSQYIHVNEIRHTMARGMASDGTLLEVVDVAEVQRMWRSLQVRQYLKVALETLFRSCESQIHHAVAKSFKTAANGRRTEVPRSIEAIASSVGKIAQESLEANSLARVCDLVASIELARGDADSLYSAGISNSNIDISVNLGDLERKAARFNVNREDEEKRAVGCALCALLWCATEAKFLPNESLTEAGDRMSLRTLRVLTEEMADSSPQEYVAAIVRDYVINLHFDVVRERTEDDIAQGRKIKDRYRILMGDFGLERNLAGSQQLTRARSLGDILVNVLYLLAQAGLVSEKGQSRCFRLTAAGRKRAAEEVELMTLSLLLQDEVADE